MLTQLNLHREGKQQMKTMSEIVKNNLFVICAVIFIGVALLIYPVFNKSVSLNDSPEYKGIAGKRFETVSELFIYKYKGRITYNIEVPGEGTLTVDQARNKLPVDDSNGTIFSIVPRGALFEITDISLRVKPFNNRIRVKGRFLDNRIFTGDIEMTLITDINDRSKKIYSKVAKEITR
jgi:hypothetical protein